MTVKYRTAESVSPKHPDKICDRISDAILDAYLTQDPEARVAVDVAGGHGMVFVTGEVTASGPGVDVGAIVRRIAGPKAQIIIRLARQSPEIARGVDVGGAGDQGIMIGYATSETKEKLPLEVVLARELNRHLYQRWQFDGKTQVTVGGDGISAVVASFQNSQTKELTASVEEWLGSQAGRGLSLSGVQVHANPAGEWTVGGFDADAGLTGRKLVVDNYGPLVPVGGGAFSGKDASKVDRSAAYMARRVAVDYLRSRAASEVYVRLAYAIGRREPLEATVVVDGVSEIVQGYDLSPRGIITSLNLNRPIYEATAEYGHFGNGFEWDV